MRKGLCRGGWGPDVEGAKESSAPSVLEPSLWALHRLAGRGGAALRPQARTPCVSLSLSFSTCIVSWWRSLPLLGAFREWSQAPGGPGQNSVYGLSGAWWAGPHP